MNKYYIELSNDKNWKEIINFKGYFINKNGVVVSTKQNKHHILIQQKNSKGYMYLTLRNEGKSKKIQIHRSVAFLWVKNTNIDKYNVVNHLDGNKLNNYYTNLEWTDDSGNSKHAIKEGLHIMNEGEECSWSKLTIDLVLEIRKLYDSGNHTNQEIANKYNVSRSNIYQIGKRLTWKHI